MIIKEGKRNFNDIDIRDIYSICYDIIRNDSSLYNRRHKLKLRYQGLIKKLGKLEQPITKLMDTIDEKDLDKILKRLDGIVQKVSTLRPNMKVQKLSERGNNYLLVEEDEMPRSVRDLKIAYSYAKTNEMEYIKQKQEHYETFDKPREIREKREEIHKRCEQRREAREFKEWLKESAKKDSIEESDKIIHTDKMASRQTDKEQEERE